MGAETQSSAQPAKRRARKTAVPSPRAAEVVQPREGESFASWIAAIARERGTEVKPLLREFHLHKLGALSLGQTRLPDPVARQIQRLTAVDEHVLHAMTLARYAGNALPHLPLNMSARFASI